MNENFEEKIELVKQAAEESVEKIESADRAVESAMQVADGNEERVEIAEELFEFAISLPSEVAVPLGESILQHVDDQTYLELIGNEEFQEYAEEYHEHIPPRVLREQDIPVEER